MSMGGKETSGMVHIHRQYFTHALDGEFCITRAASNISPLLYKEAGARTRAGVVWNKYTILIKYHIPPRPSRSWTVRATPPLKGRETATEGQSLF